MAVAGAATALTQEELEAALLQAGGGGGGSSTDAAPDDDEYEAFLRQLSVADPSSAAVHEPQPQPQVDADLGAGAGAGLEPPPQARQEGLRAQKEVRREHEEATGGQDEGGDSGGGKREGGGGTVGDDGTRRQRAALAQITPSVARFFDGDAAPEAATAASVAIAPTAVPAAPPPSVDVAPAQPAAATPAPAAAQPPLHEGEPPMPPNGRGVGQRDGDADDADDGAAAAAADDNVGHITASEVLGGLPHTVEVGGHLGELIGAFEAEAAARLQRYRTQHPPHSQLAEGGGQSDGASSPPPSARRSLSPPPQRLSPPLRSSSLRSTRGRHHGGNGSQSLGGRLTGWDWSVSRPFPSWDRSILTEIYLCHACSCQEILRTETGWDWMSQQRASSPRLSPHHHHQQQQQQQQQRSSSRAGSTSSTSSTSRQRGGAGRCGDSASATTSAQRRRRRRRSVSRPFPSWNRSISTEIYLCHACSCQEMLRTETAGQGAGHHRSEDERGDDSELLLLRRVRARLRGAAYSAGRCAPPIGAPCTHCLRHGDPMHLSATAPSRTKQPPMAGRNVGESQALRRLFS
jgi:hypothetical protein